jgi:hypothetical protein
MEKLMGHALHILDPWTKLEDAFFASKTFSPALLEQVRRTLALGTGCRYCQAKGARNHFADAELCELLMFMGFMWAGGTFGAVLGLEPLHSSL